MAKDVMAVMLGVAAVALGLLSLFAPIHFVWQYLIGIGALLAGAGGWDLWHRSPYPWWTGGQSSRWK